MVSYTCQQPAGQQPFKCSACGYCMRKQFADMVNIPHGQ